MGIKVFGFGSLINEDSLRKTAPNAFDLKVGYIYGYNRIFDIKASNRFCSICGKYTSALNIFEVDYESFMGGVLFEVSEKEFGYLKEREKSYIMKQIEVYNQFGEFIDNAYVFYRKGHKKYGFLKNSPKQREYLSLCVAGASSIGESFAKNFYQTTFIGEKTLEEYIHNNKLFQDILNLQNRFQSQKNPSE
ncbi:gamma-glutamylcyclotransferase family protein [Candidatus Absconditicoccus praedator]|uniref:gamma-glutamylcyclotransferase family protein n=1 Tax=Candidatus Absconditicoccus praedator TaxID=2735562 RepID=UPI001E2A58FF|nr:gamma-glutamylcyclotransferase family protein [Candidatus Absconditicoccus praedator]UFX83232.1 gamma-glutamylcyclotransferase [Candidatus Absconditicoccus praedator]